VGAVSHCRGGCGRTVTGTRRRCDPCRLQMAMYRRRPSDERALCLMVLGWRR